MATFQDYEEMLRQLLPPGPAFPRGDYESAVAMLLEVFALELARIDSRVEALIRENDPRVCVETFREWLTEWGLPDVCANLISGMNDSTLRQLLLFRITVLGGQSRRFFAELCARFGYIIQIDELQLHTVDSQVMDGLWSQPEPHMWKVNVLTGEEDATTHWHNTLGGVQEALAWWGDQLVECLIEKYKPAHTEVIYGYYGVE